MTERLAVMQGENTDGEEDEFDGALRNALSVLHPLIYIMIPKEKRDSVAALWRYDAALTQVMQSVKEPSLQVMRLIWWRDAIMRMIDTRVAPAHPVLQALIRLDSDGLLQQAAALADHWADFVEADPLDVAKVDALALARGRILYAGTDLILEEQREAAQLENAGRYWALVDIASHMSDAALREKLSRLAHENEAKARGLPKPLGALTRLSAVRARNGGLPKPLAEQAMLLRFTVFGR